MKFKVPLPIKVVAGVYILLPAANFIFIALRFGIAGSKIFNYYSLLALALLASAPVIGVGLYLLKRWAYRAFLIHIVAFITMNIYYILTQEHPHYTYAALRTCVGLPLLWYFLRREVAAPYLSWVPRGWRRKDRIPLHMTVNVDGKKRVTKDVSESGCFVEEEGSKRKTGEQVETILRLIDGERKVTGFIMRVTGEGFGVRFESERSVRKEIKRTLKERFPVRYVIEAPVNYENGVSGGKGNTYNLSPSGMYVASDTKAKPGPIKFSLQLNGATYEGTGNIVWVNDEKGNARPKGFGVEFEAFENRDGFAADFRKVAKSAAMSR